MKNRCAWLAAIFLFLAGPASGQQEALSVGVVPYLTPNVLINLFQPVRRHLESTLGRSVDLYTSPDVKSFVKRTLKPDFDLVITAAHHARLAQVEAGYVPLARFSGPLHAAVVVAGDAKFRELKDLHGQRIAITDRSILVNIAAIKALADLGIGEKDVFLIPANSQNTAILAVARGDADAAIIAHFTLNQIPAEQRSGVRLLFQSGVLPNVTLLAKPTLPGAEIERIRQALLRLPATPDGSRFLQQSGFQGIEATDDTYMKKLDVYLPETRRQLGP